MGGSADGFYGAALAERDGGACDAGNRIPTARFPVWSHTEVAQIAIGAAQANLDFEAERDYLYTDMSVTAQLADGTAVPAFVSVDYCHTTYMQTSDIRNWAPCCQRKPLFLVGQRENKRLRVTVDLGAAALAATDVAVTLSGFQGTGCCG
jgi:hypothetical protein